MRSGALVAASIVAIGLYMLLGAVLVLPMTWIGLGMLAIMLVAAAGAVATSPDPSLR